MRLRPLTEAECYARCYGGRREESVSLVSAAPVDRRPPWESPLDVDGRAVDPSEGAEAA